MNIIYSSYELQRKNAILLLWELADKWENDDYSINDFYLDKFLRKLQSLPEKELGKPPYQWLQ